MVNPGKFPRALKRHNVLWLCNNADNRTVAAVIVADVAHLFIGKPLTDLAEMNFSFGVNKRLGEFFGALGRLLQYTECKPLRGLSANTGQSLKLCDKLGKRNYIISHY